MKRIGATGLLVLVIYAPVRADGAGDNLADKVRRIPPPGIELGSGDRQVLETDIDELGAKIKALKSTLKSKPALLELLPDVEVYHKAVRWTLDGGQFYNPKHVSAARGLLKQGMERATFLEQGKAPWNTATGLVVRGYVSKIDGSVQPYGMVVPASYHAGAEHKHRLDFWFHGRGEQLSEVAFILDRQSSPGAFTPPGAFVLHPYGRYCCANKLAGEVDAFEALEHARKHYPIDEDRITVRGFSMGGAACWQFAVHYAGLWAAAAPGAGFSETADFLKVFQNETLQPTEYEKKLWHLYDCTDYAVNLANCPTVAYSGEKDSQKQAADMMQKAMAAEGLELVHLIGPGKGHEYHPDSKVEINRRIDAIVARGRRRVPPRVHFTTWTLHYNEMAWLRVDGLGKHWERARVDATASAIAPTIRIKSENVTAFTLSMPPGECPFDPTAAPQVVINTQRVEAARVASDRSWTSHFRKEGGDAWKLVASIDDGTLRKRHGLQGPIDDAFLDRFLMVKPTGTPLHEKTGTWATTEMEHARTHWRLQFRGDVPTKNDVDVTDADVAASNLVLWGDPSSNKVLARILDKLPLRWNAETVQLGDKTYPSANHVPLIIFPNPLNPKRYVVLNSGFTYREYDYLNNARQVPKLPDYAVVDVNTPPSSRAPGKVVDAGFFDEAWKIPK